MDLKTIFANCSISEEDYIKKGLKIEDLNTIFLDYENYKHNTEPIENLVVNFLKGAKEVKYLKSRLKDSEHLIGKIIRKQIENPERIINVKNYREEITDLIGVRALHLFKEEWISIHDYIISNWELNEDAIAYVRKGDPESITNTFIDKGLKVEHHQRGYRSIHYVLKLQPTKHVNYVEIQVRTIFEEAWSEIDHLIGYPYPANSTVIEPYLELFNRLAGHANEMGSYLRRLDENERLHKEETLKLEQQIKNLKIDVKEKDKLLNQLKKSKSNYVNHSDLNSGIFVEPITGKGIFSSDSVVGYANSSDFNNVFLQTPTSKGVRASEIDISNKDHLFL